MGDWSSGMIFAFGASSRITPFCFLLRSKHAYSIAAFRIQIPGHAFLSHAVLARLLIDWSRVRSTRKVLSELQDHCLRDSRNTNHSFFSDVYGSLLQKGSRCVLGRELSGRAIGCSPIGRWFNSSTSLFFHTSICGRVVKAPDSSSGQLCWREFDPHRT